MGFWKDLLGGTDRSSGATENRFLCLAVTDKLANFYGEKILLRDGLPADASLHQTGLQFVTFWRAKAENEEAAHECIRQVLLAAGMGDGEVITVSNDPKRMAQHHLRAFDTFPDGNASTETEGSIAFARSSASGRRTAIETATRVALGI